MSAILQELFKIREEANREIHRINVEGKRHWNLNEMNAWLRRLDAVFTLMDRAETPDYNENELDLFRRGRSGDATDAYLARVKGCSHGG